MSVEAYLRVHGKKVHLIQDGKSARSISEEEFVRRVADQHRPPDDFFPIPRGARFYVFAGLYGVVVVELEPKVHAFRWIKDIQEGQRAVHLGANAQYENRSFALPYTVLILPFFNGILQNGACQVFYRNAPLSGWDDPLLMTNLLNVATGYGFTSWLCMAGYSQRKDIPLSQAVEEAIRYFFWAAFNRSSEVHERNSHYSAARNARLDERIASAAAWESASMEDPRFMLGVPWGETGHSVRSAVALAISKLPAQEMSLINLVQNEGRM